MSDIYILTAWITFFRKKWLLILFINRFGSIIGETITQIRNVNIIYSCFQNPTALFLALGVPNINLPLLKGARQMKSCSDHMNHLAKSARSTHIIIGVIFEVSKLSSVFLLSMRHGRLWAISPVAATLVLKIKKK